MFFPLCAGSAEASVFTVSCEVLRFGFAKVGLELALERADGALDLAAAARGVSPVFSGSVVATRRSSPGFSHVARATKCEHISSGSAAGRSSCGAQSKSSVRISPPTSACTRIFATVSASGWPFRSTNTSSSLPFRGEVRGEQRVDDAVARDHHVTAVVVVAARIVGMAVRMCRRRLRRARPHTPGREDPQHDAAENPHEALRHRRPPRCLRATREVGCDKLGPMKEALVRFGVAMESTLLAELDALVEQRGGTRSELLRDLVRAETTRAKVQTGGQAVAALTLVYDHHVRDLTERLTEFQHALGGKVTSTLHIHLDHDHCLEVIVMRGPAQELKRASEKLLATRGVKHGGVELIALPNATSKPHTHHQHGRPARRA